MLLFIAFVVTVLWRLGSASCAGTRGAQAVFLMFLGVSIAALFLHAWEDSAVAYTVWVLCAAGLGVGKRQN
jgi:hypothetical protein